MGISRVSSVSRIMSQEDKCGEKSPVREGGKATPVEEAQILESGSVGHGAAGDGQSQNMEPLNLKHSPVNGAVRELQQAVAAEVHQVPTFMPTKPQEAMQDNMDGQSQVAANPLYAEYGSMDNVKGGIPHLLTIPDGRNDVVAMRRY